MEIEVDKAIEHLSSVAPLCNGRVSPVLYNARIFYDTSGWIGCAGTDLNTSLQIGRCEGEWFAVNAAKLLAALKALPEGSKAKVILDKGGVQIVCGSSRFKMPTCEPGDYPAFSVAEPGVDPIHLPLSWLIEASAVVSPAVGKDSSKSALTGIIFEVRKDGADGKGRKVWVNGCDGRRMIVGSHLAELPENGNCAEVAASVPVGVFKALGTLSTGDGVVRVAAGKNTIRIEGGGWVILSRQVEGKIPDWRMVLGTGVHRKKTCWTGTAGALRTAIGQCLLIDDERSRLDWRIEPVGQVKAGEEEPKGTLQMEAHDMIDGEAKAEAIGDVDGVLEDFHVNGRFVLDALRGEKDEDEVKLFIYQASMKLHIVRSGYDALVMGMA